VGLIHNAKMFLDFSDIEEDFQQYKEEYNVEQVDVKSTGHGRSKFNY
jgi:hypothetical protein